MICTICVFRVLIPHKWSLAKQGDFKNWNVMPQKCRNKLKQNGMVYYTLELQFQSIFNTENFDARRYDSTEADHRTWLHVPSGTLWSTSSTHDLHIMIFLKLSSSSFTQDLVKFE